MAREILGVTGAIVGGMVAGPAGARWGFVIGSTIGGIIDPPTFDGPKLGDASVQTSRDGIPIPIAEGLEHVVGNLIAMNDIVDTTEKSGSKKTGKTNTPVRKRTFAIGIARSLEGPIVGLQRCWENNKLIYDTRDGSTFPAEDNTAFEANTTLYLGDETQLPDPELESQHGVGTTPAHRGLAYIVFINKDITNFGSSIPTYRFEIEASNLFPGASDHSATEGHKITQQNFVSGVDHRSPWTGLNADEFTMMSVCRPVSVPAPSGEGWVFGVGASGSSTQNMRVAKVASVNNLFRFNLVNVRDAGGTGNITDDFFNITSGHPTWSLADWYCWAITYKASSSAGSVMIVNLTKGEEESRAIAPARKGPGWGSNVAWRETTDGTNFSRTGWGVRPDVVAVPPVIHPFLGQISQTLIADNYMGVLTDAANRRRLCGIDGVIPLGNNGSIVFGSVPLYFTNTGFPSDNQGTWDVGGPNNTEWWLEGTEVPSTTLPPEAT